MEFGCQIRDISYQQVDDAVMSFDGTCERTVPTNSVFGQHRLIDENGFELSMEYMPIDSSYDSNDFGNVEKEMLCSITLSCENKYIQMSNSMHTREVAYTTYSEDRAVQSKTVGSLAELVSFFEREMGGIVPGELRNIEAPENKSVKIKNTVEYRAKEYTNCALTDCVVNVTTGQEQNYHIVLVYIEYARNTSLDKTKEMIEVYSDDMAAYIAQEHDTISEVYVFWTVPKYYGTDIAAKCSYEANAGHAYIVERYGLLFK